MFIIRLKILMFGKLFLLCIKIFNIKNILNSNNDVYLNNIDVSMFCCKF